METNIFINDDCLDIMREMPDKSIDLVLTDPPYGISLSRGYKNEKDLVKGDEGFSVMFFLDDILREYKRILKDNSAVYIFTRFDVMPYWWLKIKNYFDCKNLIVWDKGGVGMGDLQGNYGNSNELIMFVTNGEHKLNGKREGNVWKYSKSNNEYHPTQKPIELTQNIIKHSSNENDLVLDCFSGSGTTAIACHNLNRRFICIEKDKEYYEKSVIRYEKHIQQIKMFT